MFTADAMILEHYYARLYYQTKKTWSNADWILLKSEKEEMEYCIAFKPLLLKLSDYSSIKGGGKVP